MLNSMTSIIDSEFLIANYKQRIKNVKKSKDCLDMIIPRFKDNIMSKFSDNIAICVDDDTELDVTLNTSECIDDMRIIFDNTCKDVLGDGYNSISKYAFSFNTMEIDKLPSLSIKRHK